MSSIVFDLDLTLGDMHSSFQYLMALRPSDFLQTLEGETLSLAPALQEKLHQAYRIFVKNAAVFEEQGKLGFLRPGILDLFRKLQAQKRQRKVMAVAMQSNNASLETLEFVRDVLDASRGISKSFCSLVHWGHPIRMSELVGFPKTLGPKTWEVLQAILRESNCQVEDPIRNSQVVFVDDNSHPDLQKELLHNYCKIAPQSQVVPNSRVQSLFDFAVRKAGLDDDPRWFEALEKAGLFPSKYRGRHPQETLLESLTEKTGKTASPQSRPPIDEGAIRCIEEALQRTFKRQRTPSNLEWDDSISRIPSNNELSNNSNENTWENVVTLSRRGGKRRTRRRRIGRSKTSKRRA